MTTALQDRLPGLERAIAEGRIIRGSWYKGLRTDDGYERACLLAALVPECGEQGTAAACPADVLPAWLAVITPAIDDRTSDAAWPALVQRYGQLLRRTADAAWSPQHWRRLTAAWFLAVLAEACGHGSDDVIASVQTLWERVARGEEPTVAEWTETETEAEAAAAEAEAAAWAEARAAAICAARAATWDSMVTCFFNSWAQLLTEDAR